MTRVVALSGGADSTAMALRLRETNPETPWRFLCTPTGNELPEMLAHWERLEERQFVADGISVSNCYHQRIGEWRNLLERHPDLYANAEQQEAATGHTFRSPGRDSHPVALADLRRSFERQPSLPMFMEEDEGPGVCRVCSL